MQNTQVKTALSGASQAEVSTGELVVGRIPYLVCAPFFLDTLGGMEGVRFVDGPPSLLNAALQRGEIDCAPASSVEFARNQEAYYIVPGFSTGGQSRVNTVLFLSQLPWVEISGQPVRLSLESATSNLLFQVLCQKRHHVDPTYHLSDAAVGRLVIGNEALLLSHTQVWAFRYDLAEEWYKWQGMPFSFGLWLVRRDSLEKKAGIFREFMGRVARSRAEFLREPDAGVRKWLKRYHSDIPERVFSTLYEHADYGLSPLQIKSVLLFFKICSDSGFIPPCESLVFLPGE